MASVLILAIWSLLLPFTLADLECSQFVPHGSKGNVGVMNFAGQGTENYIQPTNASVGHNIYIPHNQDQPGTNWHFETCNSTSLNLGPSAVTNDCYDSGCQKYYNHDIRIINPASGHCLTARPLNGLYVLTPEMCNGNPTTTVQIFQTLQYVYYTPFYKQRIGYGQVNVVPFGYGPNYDQTNDMDPWVIGSDHKTLFYNPPKIGISPNSLHGNIIVPS